jgi:WD40 repeat protein
MLAELEALLASDNPAATSVPAKTAVVSAVPPSRKRTFVRALVAAVALAALLVGAWWAFGPRPGGPAPSSPGREESEPRWDEAFRRSITRRGLEVDLKGRIPTVVFSRDRRWLAAGTATGDRGVHLWNCTTGGRRLLLSGRSVRGLVFSADSQTLAVATLDEDGGAVVLLDPVRGSVRRELPLKGAAGSQLLCVAMTVEGQVHVAGLGPGPDKADPRRRLSLWQPTEGPTPLPSPPGIGSIWAVDFAPDGRSLATAGYDGRVSRWAWPPRVRGPQLGSAGALVAVAFSPDGTTLMAAREGSLLFHDCATGKTQSIGNASHAQCAAFTSDNRLLAQGQGAAVCLTSVRDGGELRRLTRPVVAPEKADEVRAVAFSPDGEVLAAGFQSGTLLLWDVAKERRQAARE